MRPWLVVVAAAFACRGNAPPLYPAGSDKDEGHGLLAQASTQFLTTEGEDGLVDAHRYGGSGYGGAAYGGATYGNYVVPQWPVQAPNRTPKYNQVSGLTGAIEGTITLRKHACGDAAIIYIEKVQVGRYMMNEGRPASVGGTIVKRACGLAPVAQIVTPLPAALAIHGDAKPTKLTIAGKAHELQPAARFSMQLSAGVTRIDADGSTAWVLAVDTPYYAVTDDRGRYRIDELAAGTYELTIWQPPIGAGEPIVTKRAVHVRETRRLAPRDPNGPR